MQRGKSNAAGGGGASTSKKGNEPGSTQHKREANMAMALHLCDQPSERLYPKRQKSYQQVVEAQSNGAIDTCPHPDTMKHYMLCAYQATKAPMLDELSKAKDFYGPLPFIHLITDIWTARRGDGYITVDIQYIDKTGEKVEMHLGVRRFNIAHNHTTIATSLREMLCSYGIETNVSDMCIRECTEEEGDDEDMVDAEADASDDDS